MKNLTLLCSAILTMLMWSPGHAQVPVGFQDGVTSYMPIYSYYGYNYTQQLIYESEINSSGDITSISFYVDQIPSGASNSNDWTIYLGHTAKTGFSSNTDWVPLTDINEVYSGTVTFPAAGNQMTIIFDTAFTYNGTQNLVVAVDENKLGYDSEIYFGKTKDFGAYRSIYYYNDSTNPDPASPPSGSRVKYINTITLGGIQQACPNPTDLAVTAVTPNTADISWTDNASANQYNIKYGAPNFDPENTGMTASADGSGAVTLTNLSIDTSYEFYVQAQCGGSDGDSAFVGPISFTTDCTAVAAPWNGDFENGGDIPDCWRQGENNNHEDWLFHDPPMYDNHIGNGGTINGSTPSGGHYAWVRSQDLYNQITTLISPRIDVSALTIPELTFYLISDKEDDVNIDFSVDVYDGTAWNDDVFTSNANTVNGGWEEITVDLSSLTITGAIQIRFIVDNPENSYTDDLAIDDVSIHEQSTCSKPTNLTINGMTSTSVDISWIAGGNETTWMIKYSSTPNFDPETEGDSKSVSSSADTTLTDLTPNTTYKFYIQAQCSSGGYSTFSGPVKFTTPCAPTTVPYTEDFESVTTPDLPNCSSLETISGNDWKTANETNYGLNSKVLEYTASYSSDADTWFFTQGVELQAGTSYQISYIYGGGYQYSTEKLKVSYGTSPMVSAMTTELDNHPDITGIPETKVAEVIFSVSSTGTYYFGFNAYSDEGQDLLYVDDISLDLAPTCIKPEDLTVTNITENNADISWTTTAIQSDVYVALTGDPAPDGSSTPTYNGVASPKTLNNLAASAAYEIYVRADCGAQDGVSDWVKSLSFSTPCESATVPYAEDFESVTVPDLPNCTSIETISGKDWKTSSLTNYGFNSNVLQYSYDNVNDSWFFTQGIELEAGTDYQINYTYGNNSNGYTEKLKVSYGTSASASAMNTEELANHPNISGAQATPNEVIFSVPSNGTYYFGFNAYSDSGQYYLYIDDISVDIAPTCLKPTDLTVVGTTATTGSVSWTAGDNENDWEVKYSSTSGFDPETEGDSKSINGSASTTLEELNSGTDYEFYVKADCGVQDGVSKWVGPVTFTTLCEAATIPYTEGFDSVALPELPNCTSTENMGQGNDWETRDPSSLVSGYTGNVLNYVFMTYEPANTWFFTQGVELTAGETYQISYKYGDYNSVEKLKVSYGTSPVASAMTNQLADHITDGDKTIINNPTAYFTADADDVYYFGFNAHSDANKLVLFLDEISVDLAPTCLKPTDLAVTNNTVNSADISWTTISGQSDVYVALAEDPAPDESSTPTYSAVTSPMSLNNLDTGTAYKVYVRADCGVQDGVSDWADPVTFTVEYCTIDFSSGGTGPITYVDFAGIENTSYQWSDTPYEDFTGMTANVEKGESYSITLKGKSSSYAYYTVFIDWNQNGILDDEGEIYEIGSIYNSTGTDGESVSGTIEVPTDKLIGATRMRVIKSGNSLPTDPCGIYGFGQAEDYTVEVIDLSPCPAPTVPSIDALSATTAGISWISNGSETDWVVKYSDTPDFDPETEGSSQSASGSSSATLTGLDPETTYEFYLQAQCNGSDNSSFVGPVKFTTPCISTTIPYTEDFESTTYSDLPDCTSMETISGNDWETISLNYSGVIHRVLSYDRHFSQPANTWFFTQGIELETGVNYQISYTYGCSSLYSSTEKLKVSYGTAPIASAMNTELDNHPNINNSAEDTTGRVDFTVSVNGTYYFGFNAYSDSGQNRLYVDDIFIDSCPRPSDPTVDAFTSTTADISWTAGGSENDWLVKYGEPDFAPETEGSSKSVSGPSSTTLTNLDPNTTYEVYVQTQCSGSEGTSAFVGPVEFTTPCVATTVPYIEDFESAAPPNLPDCTRIETISGNDWKTSNYPPSGYTGKILRYYMYNGSPPSNTWFFSQGVQLSTAVQYQISYKYSNGFSSPEKLKVSYGTSPTASAMTTELADEATDGDETIINNQIVYFNVSADGVYYFGFNMHSNNGTSELFLDDISIEEAPGCLPPSDLTATVDAATPTTANISWTAGDSETEWEVKYGEAGFDVSEPAAYQTQSVNGIPNTTLTGLMTDTDYEVYVKSQCGSGDGDSPFAGPIEFSTPCTLETLPYIVDFESVTPGNFPDCTSNEKVGTWSNNWFTSSSSPSGYTGNVLRYNFTHYYSANTWFLTKGVELTAGVQYQISYKYGDYNEVEKLKVSYGTSADASAMTTQLAYHTTDGDKTIINDPIIYFSVNTDDVYYFGFKADSDAGASSLFVDDISIEEVPSCLPTTDLTVDATTDTIANISWTEGDNETDWIVNYSDIPNFDPETEGSSEAVSGLPNTELSGLSPNTTYEVYVKTDCGSGDESDFVGPKDFTTGCLGSPSLSFLGTGEFQNSIVSPTQGTPETTYEFKVVYTNEEGALPPYGFPRVMLDYEGNGSFTNTNDRAVILSAADPNDTDTSDGKVYVGAINQLPPGTDWQAWVQVQTDGCDTEIGPFDAPDVLIAPDLELFANDIVFDNPNPDPSSPLQITATIHNKSDLPAENFVMHLENQFDTNAVYPDITVDHLDPQESTSVVWNIITPAIPSWDPMEVFVDYTNVIIESNELNNRAMRPFINGDFNLPGAINIQASASPSVVELPSFTDKVTVSGYAYYTETAIELQDSTVAGATVTFINPITGNQTQTHTNANGYFTFQTYHGSQPGPYTAPVKITDFTLSAEAPVTWELILGPCLPDLSTQFFPSNKSIFVGESVSGVIKVTNQGCAPVEVETLLEMDQTGGLPLIEDVTIPPLEPGESYTHNFTAQFDTEGTYYITGLADANEVIQESSENNNLGSSKIKVFPQLPDITPGGSLYNTQSLCSASSSHSFSIKNIGYTATGVFENTIKVYFEGSLEGTFTRIVQNIDPGESTPVSISFVYQQVGSYSFVLICDADGVVEEISETNNDRTYNTNIVECKPDLLVVSGCNKLVVDPIDPVPGTVTYTAQVKNMGSATAPGPVEFEFTLSNGAVYPLVYQDDISLGEQVTFTTDPVPSVSSGGTELTATVDPNDLIADLNLNNNSTSETLCWEFRPVPRSNYNFWDFVYNENESTQLSIGLKAEHLYQASEVKILFEVSGPGITGWESLGDAAVQNVKATCSGSYAAVLPTSFVFNQIGVYTFRMTSDPDHEYDECDEGNNVLIKEVTVANKPDMRILSQYINPTLLNPDPGQSIFFQISYENIGYSNITDEMDLTVEVDNDPLAVVQNVPGLIKNTTNTIAVPIPYSSQIEGLHVARATIDSNHDVNDANWSNNEATRSFVVGAAANLHFDEFNASNETPEVGETITIEAQIANNGELDVDADVLFSYVTAVGDTIPIGTKPVSVLTNGLPPVSPTSTYTESSVNTSNDDNQTVSLSWAVQESPVKVLGEIINSTELEFDYTDNFASTQLNNFNVSIVATMACEGQNMGTLTAQAANGTAPYTYNWSNGFIGEVLEAQAGTYGLIVVDAGGREATAVGTIEEDPDCMEETCSLTPVDFDIPPSCNPVTGMYTTTLIVAYENEPTQGLITVNGTDYPITGSPQSFEVDFEPGPVVYTISFTADTNCNLTIATGIMLDECDNEGYIYLNDTDGWIPGNPNNDVNFTSSDNIKVLEGTASFTGDIEVNDITVNSGATLNVESVLTINGDITNNGELVFKSNATSNGELAAVPASSTITGNVTVERYTSDHRAYRFVSSAVSTSNAIHANWQEGAMSATDNPNPGYGTHITGSTTDQQNGFDATSTGNPSLFTLNIGTQAFEAVANTNTNKLNPGDGYLLYVRGDRSIDLSSNDSHGSTILRATGVLQKGDMTQSLGNVASGDFVAVVNPYQSGIDVNEVIAASQNLNANYAYVYDATIGAIGAYVTVDLTDNNGAGGQYIQPGQAVQVATASSAATSITYKESAKAPGNHNATFSNNSSDYAQITGKLFVAENYADGGPLHDSFSFLFAAEFSNDLNDADAVKPFNFTENMGIGTIDAGYSIERRELPLEGENLALFNTNYNHQVYTLVLNAGGFEGTTPYLVDKFTETETVLEAVETLYDFTVDQGIAESIAPDRFYIHFGEETLSVDQPIVDYGVELYPNPSKAGETFYITTGNLTDALINVKVYDLLGKLIYVAKEQPQNHKISVQTERPLSSGIYFVQISQKDRQATKRLIIK